MVSFSLQTDRTSIYLNGVNCVLNVLVSYNLQKEIDLFCLG